MTTQKTENTDGNTQPDRLPDRIIVTDTLDLHGFFPGQIQEIMDAFLENARQLNLRHVRIIHGKGKSRLKFEVYTVLRSHRLVQSFRNAPPELGGWGATVNDPPPEAVALSPPAEPGGLK